MWQWPPHSIYHAWWIWHSVWKWTVILATLCLLKCQSWKWMSDRMFLLTSWKLELLGLPALQGPVLPCHQGGEASLLPPNQSWSLSASVSETWDMLHNNKSKPSPSWGILVEFFSVLLWLMLGLPREQPTTVKTFPGNTRESNCGLTQKMQIETFFDTILSKHQKTTVSDNQLANFWRC